MAPLLLPERLALTAKQFMVVCQANPNAVLELDATGQLISITPTGGDTSARNSALIYALEAYARRTGSWKAFDSSGGFRLPDGSALNPEQRRGFPPLCPDLVVELAAYQSNGAQLGWLLIPEQSAVEVWPAIGGGEPARLDGASD